MAIKLEIHATDPEVISLVQRYWAMNEECKPVENVSAMLPFREILKPHALAEADLQRRVAKHAERITALTTNYSALPDDLAFILLALRGTISPSLFGGRFTFHDCRALSPLYSEMFITRLYKAGVISDDPRATGSSAYFVNANGLNYYREKARFFLVPDELLGGGEEAFNELVVRTYTNKQSLLALWYDYTMADCMAYLHNQLEEYRQVFPLHKTEEIKSAIYTALKYYSTRDVWSMLWRVVQTVSSNSNYKYSNREKSAGTIATKLRLQFEKARNEKTDLGVWSRLKSLPAGALGQVFYELYGIDETTDASVIIKKLSDENPIERDETEASIDAQVKELMACALANGSGAAAIYDFAELVRNGASTSEAVEQITEIYAVKCADEVSTCSEIES